MVTPWLQRAFITTSKCQIAPAVAASAPPALRTSSCLCSTSSVICGGRAAWSVGINIGASVRNLSTPAHPYICNLHCSRSRDAADGEDREVPRLRAREGTRWRGELQWTANIEPTDATPQRRHLQEHRSSKFARVRCGKSATGIPTAVISYQVLFSSQIKTSASWACEQKFPVYPYQTPA